MALIEGNIYLCEDQQIRRLDKVESDYLHYSLPIGYINNKLDWMRLNKTRRNQVEQDFVNGQIIMEDQINKGEYNAI